MEFQTSFKAKNDRNGTYGNDYHPIMLEQKGKKFQNEMEFSHRYWTEKSGRFV